MLHFFQPVMLEQALELRIKILIVLDAVHVVALDHPLDMKSRQSDAQRIVLQNFLGDCCRRSNHRAPGAKALFELALKALEQLNVFRFFTRKLEQRPRAVVIRLKLRPGVIDHERQNKLLDQSEDAKIGVTSDLVERALLFAVKEREWLNPRQ